MRIGSLFSGIGGLELGLHIALGGEIVWQVEREAWPRRVLAARYPEADRSVTDVCEACTSDSTQLAPVDLVCGGFPCQDISAAGRGAGITGEKSGLWSEYARILRVLRPRIVVVENSNLLPLRGLDVVLGDLAALGYDAEWTRIGARDVGAPHRRWRCFIVAWLPDADRLRRPREGQFATGTGKPDRESAGVPDAASQGALRLPIGAPTKHTAASIGGRHDVVDPHCDRLHLTPADCVRAGRDAVVSGAESRELADADSGRRVSLRGAERDGPDARRHEPHGRGTPCSPTAAARHLPASALRGVADGLPQWLGDGPVPRAIAGPDLWADGRAALRALGNAVVPQVAYSVGLWVRSILEREGLAL